MNGECLMNWVFGQFVNLPIVSAGRIHLRRLAQESLNTVALWLARERLPERKQKNRNKKMKKLAKLISSIFILI